MYKKYLYMSIICPSDEWVRFSKNNSSRDCHGAPVRAHENAPRFSLQKCTKNSTLHVIFISRATKY